MSQAPFIASVQHCTRHTEACKEDFTLGCCDRGQGPELNLRSTETRARRILRSGVGVGSSATVSVNWPSPKAKSTFSQLQDRTWFHLLDKQRDGESLP